MSDTPTPVPSTEHLASLAPAEDPPTLTRRRAARLFGDDTGAATAEYAIATMAAVGFAGLLVVILRSDEVRGILTDIVRHALSIPG